MVKDGRISEQRKTCPQAAPSGRPSQQILEPTMLPCLVSKSKPLFITLKSMTFWLQYSCAIHKLTFQMLLQSGRKETLVVPCAHLFKSSYAVPLQARSISQKEWPPNVFSEARFLDLIGKYHVAQGKTERIWPHLHQAVNMSEITVQTTFQKSTLKTYVPNTLLSCCHFSSNMLSESKTTEPLPTCSTGMPLVVDMNTLACASEHTW